MEIAGVYQMILTKAHLCKILIKTDKNLIFYIRTEIKCDSLEGSILRRITSSQSCDLLKVYIPDQGIESFFMANLGTIQSDHQLYLKKVAIEVAGSGWIDLRNIYA
ncbi:MAG: GIN domain-containing protein [Flavobacteriales bacterium AspAUS03]